MWLYSITTGELTAPDGENEGRGYSGHGFGLNNPLAVKAPGFGPIPPGDYTIGSPLDPPDHLGSLAMPLTPEPSTEVFGRSAFFIHGDNSLGNESASRGCIVIGRAQRQAVNSSGDRALRVTA